MSSISTHVLDTSIGKPAGGIRVTLERLEPPNVSSDRDVGTIIGTGTTDSNGRLAGLVASAPGTGANVYRLRFDTHEYLARTGRPVFYPEVVVVFVAGPEDEHFHIPLLLSPFGYSTYRGS